MQSSCNFKINQQHINIEEGSSFIRINICFVLFFFNHCSNQVQSNRKVLVQIHNRTINIMLVLSTYNSTQLQLNWILSHHPMNNVGIFCLACFPSLQLTHRWKMMQANLVFFCLNFVFLYLF